MDGNERAIFRKRKKNWTHTPPPCWMSQCPSHTYLPVSKRLEVIYLRLRSLNFNDVTRVEKIYFFYKAYVSGAPSSESATAVCSLLIAPKMPSPSRCMESRVARSWHI